MADAVVRASSRRRFLAGAGAAAVTAGLAPAGLAPAAPRRRTLRIAQSAHFVPAFDDWFDHKFTPAWGARNGVEVTVDHYSVSDLRARAAAEVATRQGHDLFGFYDPPPGYEPHVVPVSDVVAECERRYGKLLPFAHRGTFNPRTQTYFAFSDAWAPEPLLYRADWWGEAGATPDTWERIREGARRVREKTGATAGFGLAPEPDSNTTLRGLLWSYGAAEQDEAGQVTINSRATVEAIKLMTALYRESMTSDVFMWDPSSNNRAFVWGRASIIQNAISALRTLEMQNPDLAKQAALAPPAAGPKGRLTGPHLLSCYVIWRFADSVELAKQFLVDLVAASEETFRASEWYNLPTFPRALPDLAARLGGSPPGGARYGVLADAASWTVGLGHPGYTTAAIEEVATRSVIPRMFARAARGEQSAEEAARQAEGEMKRIFARWQR
jgi:multiple sugar transport system substrate-binding protein